MSGRFLGSLPNPFGVTSFPTLVMPKKLVPCLWSVILGILLLIPTPHPPSFATPVLGLEAPSHS